MMSPCENNTQYSGSIPGENVHVTFYFFFSEGAFLTLRLPMSYIYIYIYIYIYMERIFLMFLDHTQRRSTVGRTPLEE